MAAPVQIILNPASSGGSGGGLRAEIEFELAARGVVCDLVQTTRRGGGVELARTAAEHGAAIIVAAGGDGTIHEAANGILSARIDSDRPPALGVIPIGTGNDFAKLLAGGKDRRAAYDAIAEGRESAFDVGLVEWQGGAEFFVNGMGTGIDVEVVRQIEHIRWISGTPRYFVGLFRALIGYRAIPLRIRADGVDIDGKVMIVAVGNGPCLGGGFYLCPGALPDDAQFDVCVIAEANLLQIVRVLPRILRGTHGKSSVVTMKRAATVEIRADGAQPLFFHLDGELREPAGARSIRVSMRAGALRVVGALVRQRVQPGGSAGNTFQEARA
jgi:diacylglycerol kinase (ATP)